MAKNKIYLHSVSYSGTFEGQHILPVDKFILKAKKLGYDGVELVAKRPHVSPLDYDDKALARLKDFIESNGMEVATIAGYHDFSHDTLHPDMPYNELQLTYLKEELRIAVGVGAPQVRVYGGFLHAGVDWHKQREWVVSALKEGAKLAGEYGVTLALQNHNEIGHHHQDVLDIIKEVGSENLKVALDPGYVAVTGVPLDKAVHDVGSLIVQSTFNDFNFRPFVMWGQPATPYMSLGTYLVNRWDAVAIGEGEIDYKSFLRALMEIGYEGWLGFEICGPIEGGGSEENLDRMAKKSLENIRALLDEVEKSVVK